MPSMSEEMYRTYKAEILRALYSEHEALFGRRKPSSPTPHGAIDFDRGADGIWRIPRTWADGDTVYFGVDPAQPGSDRMAFHYFWRSQ